MGGTVDRGVFLHIVGEPNALEWGKCTMVWQGIDGRLPNPTGPPARTRSTAAGVDHHLAKPADLGPLECILASGRTSR